MSWNGSQNASKSASHRPDADATARPHTPALLRGVLSGTIIVLIVIAVWLFGHKTEQKVSTLSNSVERAVKLAEKQPQLSTNKVVAALPMTNRAVRMEKGSRVISVIARTNQSGAVIEKLQLEDGRRIEKVIPPKPIFDNVSDQLIALALSSKQGQALAPLPSFTNIDQDFANSLLNPILIKEDDSDEIKEIKMSVKEARAYIAAEIKNGWSVAECLQKHCEQMETIADRHAMAMAEMAKMKNDGATKEEIGIFRSRINEVFKEKGIPELPTLTKKNLRTK